ncbi:MAG: hypothetical protein Hyperionvirus9_62 [Hyperionvirus sp.]|uniref:Uncharacterized protein n=1 Tax=Hyperionvirus sp. TaxID=2487770 RepID=A0A3G5A8T7_9VIRU|nr:MAG: hypothetical protein Hyperionvirus9_62 [Hyperionvirus sp.]
MVSSRGVPNEYVSKHMGLEQQSILDDEMDLAQMVQ